MNMCRSCFVLHTLKVNRFLKPLNRAKNIVGILILSGNQCNCRWCQSWILSLFPDHSWYVTIHSRWFTVFENHRKDLIQHCKVSYVYILRRQMLKMVNFGEFFTLKLAVIQCYQTGHIHRPKIVGKCQNSNNSNATFWVLPDSSILIGKKCQN